MQRLRLVPYYVKVIIPLAGGWGTTMRRTGQEQDSKNSYFGAVAQPSTPPYFEQPRVAVVSTLFAAVSVRAKQCEPLSFAV